MLKRIKGFTLIELLIVVAIIAILAAIAVPNFLEAQTRAKVSRVRADMRSLATGLESYFVDNNSYPAQDSSFPAQNGWGANDLPAAGPTLRNLPTFRRKKDQNDRIYTLTTPISYMTNLFPDVFANTRGATFEYSVGGNFNQGYLMWSFGPDTDEGGGGLQIGGVDIGGDIGCFMQGVPKVDTNYYNPGQQVPSMTLTNATYDPTNGTTSNGDVWRAKD